MTNFIPGKIVKKFTLKSGEEAIIRYPRWEDLDEMISFINRISIEDIYTTLSKEIIYKEGEMHFLSEMFKAMELNNGVYLGVFVNGYIAGSASILRENAHRKRSYHVGMFGVNIDKNFRSLGIGLELSRQVLQEARVYISGIRMFTLNVYEPNLIARSLYKKLGFKECGQVPNAIWHKGSYIDLVNMYMPI